MRLLSILYLLISCLLTSMTVHAETHVLYDGALGTLPSTQGWLYGDTPLFSSDATQAMTGNTPNSVNMDSTTTITDSSGYFSDALPLLSPHPNLPILNRNQGYHVNFGLEVLSETHVNNDRAGFSIIALSSDNIGIEMAFWENEIWAQHDGDPLFTHGEKITHTTTVQTLYDLFIFNNNYELRADDNLILTGLLRDYSAHSNAIYSKTNFLFFGDDTSSASANINLDSFSVTTVPLPAGFWLFATALIGLYRRQLISS